MEKNKKIQKRKDCIISIYKVLQTLNKNKGKESVINVYFYTLIVQAKMEKLKKNFLELPALATKQIILNFSREEGTSVPDTITRVLTTLTEKKFGELYTADVGTIRRKGCFACL